VPVDTQENSGELQSRTLLADKLIASSKSAADASDARTNLSRSVRILKNCFVTQDEDIKQLFQKAAALEAQAEKSRSPVVKEAIEELLAAVGEIKEKRDSFVRAVNSTLISTSALEAEARRPPTASGPGASTSNVKHISVSTQTSLGSEYFTKAKKSNAGTQTSSTAPPDVGTERRSEKKKHPEHSQPQLRQQDGRPELSQPRRKNKNKRQREGPHQPPQQQQKHQQPEKRTKQSTLPPEQHIQTDEQQAHEQV